MSVLRSKPAVLAAGCGAILIAAGGLALVLSGPWNGQTRTELGSAAITGLIVGLALVLIERSVEQRRTERERETRERLFSEASRDAFARLLVAHIELLWSLLVDYLDDERYLAVCSETLSDDCTGEEEERANNIGEPPPGLSDGDTRSVWGALAWFIERTRNDTGWWRAASLLVRVDALAFVSIDLLERKGFLVDHPEWYFHADPRLKAMWTRTLAWLSNLTQRLLEHDDAVRAFALDKQVQALQFLEVPAYGTAGAAELITPWKTNAGVHMGMALSPLHRVRDAVAWLIDQLRADAVQVNASGLPVSRQGAVISDVADPATYRWGPILADGEDVSRVWDCRFIEGSWLRRMLHSTNRDWREMIGDQLHWRPSRSLSTRVGRIDVDSPGE